MIPIHKVNPLAVNRRVFFKGASASVGLAALANLLGADSANGNPSGDSRGALPSTHFAPKAKRIIYLFQSGGPAQQDLFDYKPLLNEMNGQELPSAVRGEQRLTGMSVNQSSLPLAGSHFKFAQYGQSGAWLSELLPYHRDIVDNVCFIKTMHTEAINHDPAITMFQTGSQIAGRPSLGAWLTYGLGSENVELPGFIVLVTAGQGDQPLYSRLWGNGFLDSKYQGVQFRSGDDPVLYLSNPAGVSATRRRAQLDAIGRLNQRQFQKELDPEIQSRIAQYEMAYRMQTSVPDATNFADEPESTFKLYGEDARKPGTFAANCLLARRLAERDVRFIQLYHQGWDQHSNLPKQIRGQAKETDQASAALVKDLKQRGLLDDTLVIWGGEFGRTSYTQGVLTHDNYGRDHHPRCFTTWMAGGGIKPGISHGTTDDFGYNVVENGVHVHDLNATILHQMGIDHERLTYKYQGRRFRLTDVHGEVIEDILT
ncbi:DUF1501 domain-containing protein [Neorhodopirellula pilleata]|uniref:Sulfatase n=1 Tax=Neorhodopirellula pilleata TaxID=2714738 RepID=A0A5C5ZDD3_9BACT|nr:DUF1501 domain-containing protein [Neorhodopirellula pilleata]TWT85185.1 hypothetical protein Pla100_62870 [Neorhodopirellula pilleata]